MDKLDFWVPLESNPEVLTKFVHKIGVPEDWMITDVWGLDEDALGSVPQPVAALILLLPAGVSRPDLGADPVDPEKAPTVFYMTQNIYNACGTVALIHAVANSPIVVQEDSILGRLIHGTQNLSPTERGATLETVDKLNEAHKESALEGQTTAPSAESTTSLHFVALVHRDGRLWELDGTRCGLVNHGETSSAGFLSDAAAVCRRILSANPGEHRFSVLALTGNKSDGA